MKRDFRLKIFQSSKQFQFDLRSKVSSIFFINEKFTVLVLRAQTDLKVMKFIQSVKNTQ